jgi:hypothetical protein
MLEGAKVTVTPLGTTLSSTTVTDSRGHFSVVVQQSAKYVVHVKARDGTTARIVADRMPRGLTSVDVTIGPPRVLPSVTVGAMRAPEASARLAPAFGQSEIDVPFTNADLSPSDQASVGGAIETIAGIRATEGGFSVLGLPAEQSRVTFNGADAGSIILPRSAPVFTKVNTNPHDVSKGGFSGGLLTIEPRAGSNFVLGTLSVSAQPALLQPHDYLSRLSARQESNFGFDFSRSAPIIWDRLAYTISGQIRRAARNPVFLNPDSPASVVGLDHSTLVDLFDAFTARGIPFGESQREDTRVTNDGSFLVRLDHKDGGARSSLTANGSFAAARMGSSSLFSVGSYSETETTQNFSVQAQDERAFSNRFLHDLRAGLSSFSQRSRPASELPSGIVLVGARTPGDESAVPIHFGGSGDGMTSSETRSANVSSVVSWYNPSGTRLRKASLEFQATGIRNNSAARAGGQYFFLSPDALRADNAATFVRDLSRGTARGTFYVFSASIGETGGMGSSDDGIQYGVRLDSWRLHPQLQHPFSPQLPVSEDYRVNQWKAALSPRIALTRIIDTSPANRLSIRSLKISAGTGLFRSTAPQVVSTPLTLARWRSTPFLRLTCEGSSVPASNWREFAESADQVPSKCVEGSAGTAESAQEVTLLARDFRPPVSWRTNLAGSARVGLVSFRLEGVVSVNRSMSDLEDLNHSGLHRFALANEGDRPIFVRPEDITATGIVLNPGNRIDPDYRAMWRVNADAKSLSRQIILSIGSANPSVIARRSWQLSYAREWVDESRRGFSTSTAGDPSDMQRMLAPLSTAHQVILKGATVFGHHDEIELSAHLRVHSGLRFTPLVDSDINGDGLPNDRAWIFGEDDPVTGSGISGLRQKSSTRIQRCLDFQSNAMARPSSCSGGWGTSSNLNVRVRGELIGLPLRSRITANIANPVALTDRILHGGNLHGWGSLPFVDPVLLTVTGFDHARNQFRYAVNPRFGSGISSRTISNLPYRISFSVSMPISPTWGQQTAETDLAPGRWRPGTTKSAQDLLDGHLQTLLGFDPIARIGRGADSARYTRDQLSAIRSIVGTRDSALRAIFTEPAALAATMGHDPTRDEKRALVRQRSVATDSAVAILVKAGLQIKEVLTPAQIDRLSPAARSFLNRDDILRLRRLNVFVY